MTDLLASLNDDQHLLIRCIGEPFLQHQQWPLFDYIEAELDKRGLDARQVIASLPVAGESGAQHFRYGLVWYSRTIPTADIPICLTVAGLWHLAEPLSLTICDQFICVLRCLIKRRLSIPSSPFKLSTVQITDQDIAAAFPNMIPAAISRLGQFLPHEAATYYGATDPDPNGEWRMPLQRELLRYQGINTAADYIERAAQLLTPVAIEPEPAAPSPLELCATLDYFNAVWQLHFERKTPIIRLFGAERTARLVYTVSSADEFSTQVSCITDILKNMQVAGRERHALVRLQTYLESQLPEDSHARIAHALATLRDVAEVRNALFQHSGTEHRGLRAVSNLGIGFPITDWQAAWDMVQRQVIAAFNSLREEIQQFHEIEG